MEQLLSFKIYWWRPSYKDAVFSILFANLEIVGFWSNLDGGKLKAKMFYRVFLM